MEDYMPDRYMRVDDFLFVRESHFHAGIHCKIYAFGGEIVTSFGLAPSKHIPEAGKHLFGVFRRLPAVQGM